VVLDSEPKVLFLEEHLDPDHLMFEDIEVGEPWFSVGEVGKFFFARTPHWVRWREEKGFFTLDGRDVATTRTDLDVTGKPGHRRYNLADIEKMAHALAEKGAMSSAQLRRTLRLVEMEARLWDYLE
jgi:hypothetical protein